MTEHEIRIPYEVGTCARTKHVSGPFNIALRTPKKYSACASCAVTTVLDVTNDTAHWRWLSTVNQTSTSGGNTPVHSFTFHSDLHWKCDARLAPANTETGGVIITVKISLPPRSYHGNDEAHTRCIMKEMAHLSRRHLSQRNRHGREPGCHLAGAKPGRDLPDARTGHSGNIPRGGAVADDCPCQLRRRLSHHRRFSEVHHRDLSASSEGTGGGVEKTRLQTVASSKAGDRCTGSCNMRMREFNGRNIRGVRQLGGGLIAS